ncbi:MAG: alpha/beta hydrolase [Pedosphaera sp.]|nr:alpha/beta hydrolase [Pedosphaera sp.]
MTAASHYFEHDSLRFHYREAGSGIPFVFQHGLGGDSTQTFGLFSPPPGFRLITLDCRGHGETHPLGPEEKLSIPQFAEDLRALLDSLHLEQVILGGISLGAATVLHTALTWPERVRGLVLSRPAWLDTLRTEGFEIFGFIARLIRRYGAFQGAIRFQESHEFQRIRDKSPDNALSLLAQFAHPRAEETVAKLERLPLYQPAHPASRWEKIGVPTLILGSREDLIHPWASAVEYAHRIPGAELYELTPKSAGKEQHALETQRFISEFLVKLAPQSNTIPSTI